MANIERAIIQQDDLADRLGRLGEIKPIDSCGQTTERPIIQLFRVHDDAFPKILGRLSLNNHWYHSAALQTVFEWGTSEQPVISRETKPPFRRSVQRAIFNPD
jgi:hypothetical protein